ncbi:hypothetical protein X798_05780 [Onchocerca flexuosa]|uniref:Uncharacterized protein n=1 Tax=Onchocerca flexuosa TaxID=387005 RepID=A0A238BPN2_9BILA|nr:hypothetical protein X798_05780 [Onchocerca flexuosa]
MAKAEDDQGGKVMEKEPELTTERGRTRSKEDEEALDKKIAEIRKKNQLIERRKELVEEDRANFINEYGKMSLCSEAKGTKMHRNKRNLKPKKPEKWDREWDAGKTSIENWKENVPDIDNKNRLSAHFFRGFKNRSNDIRRNKTDNYDSNANNNATFKKIFNGKNAKKLKSFDDGNDGNVNVLRNMKPVSKVKQFHTGQPNRKPSGNYKKPLSELSRKRYSTRQVPLTSAIVSLSPSTEQHLDTVKVNVSMLEVKKDVETIAESNNNIGKVDNNLQKLSTTIVGIKAASKAPTLFIAKEYEIDDKDITMMEDVKNLIEEMLLKMK